MLESESVVCQEGKCEHIKWNAEKKIYLYLKICKVKKKSSEYLQSQTIEIG